MKEGAVLVDGSGLSPDNRISASMLVAALRRARASFRIGPELISSLPIAGRDGTLEERLLEGTDRIRAKTGRLADAKVLALSGIAEGGNGEEWIFSVLVNGYPGAPEEAMAALDQWVSLLVQ